MCFSLVDRKNSKRIFSSFKSPFTIFLPQHLQRGGEGVRRVFFETIQAFGPFKHLAGFFLYRAPLALSKSSSSSSTRTSASTARSRRSSFSSLDLDAALQPPAENVDAALQLPSALFRPHRSRALLRDDPAAVGQLPAEISVLEVPLPTAQSFAEELPIKVRDAGALVRALGLEQRVLARPLAGRPLGHQSSRKAGSVLVRPRGGLLQKPCLRAAEGRRGSHLEQLRRIE